MMDSTTPAGSSTPFLHTTKGLVVLGSGCGLTGFVLGWFTKSWRVNVEQKKLEMAATEEAMHLANTGS
jgi:hypothetical protein